MTTDVEKKMQEVAKGGYKAIVARHILQGQKQRQDRQLAEIIECTARKMEKLNAEELEHIELTVDAFIKRHEIRGSD